MPEPLALAAGFLFTEGIVGALSHIATMAVCADRPDAVRIRLTDTNRSVVRRRNVVINSSCGICGGGNSSKSMQPVSSACPIRSG